MGGLGGGSGRQFVHCQTRGFVLTQVSQSLMNGDTFSTKALKQCSKKFAATLKGKSLSRGNILRIFFLFLEDFGAPSHRKGVAT